MSRWLEVASGRVDRESTYVGESGRRIAFFGRHIKVNPHDRLTESLNQTPPSNIDIPYLAVLGLVDVGRT
jgi:hypothetical protein